MHTLRGGVVGESSQKWGCRQGNKGKGVMGGGQKKKKPSAVKDVLRKVG